MEKLTIEDINKVRDCAGTPVREPERTELKHIYSKLEFICQKLPKDKFNYKIRKDPRSQGGGFKNFQNYLWAKIFPVEFQNEVVGKLALIIGISDGTLHFHIMGIGEYQNEDASQTIHKNSWTELNLDYLDYDLIVQQFEKFYEVNRNSFIYAAAELGIIFFKDLVKKMEKLEKIRLLQYKKQIILQGPPGTGKTKLAKEIAEELIGNNSEISEDNIFSFFTIHQEISARKESTKYIIKEINPDSILLSTNGEDRAPTKKQIYDSYIGKLWEKSSEERKSNTLSYADALAKNLFNRATDLKDNEQLKIIQFHPSYTYEDFVRGIVAESKGEKIEYRNVNKTLGEFTEKALKNYQDARKSPESISKETWLREKYEGFKDKIEKDLENEEVLIKGGAKPKITAIEEGAVRVNRYSDVKDSVLLKDSDIINGYNGLYFTSPTIKVKENSILSKSARSGMYYLYQNLIEKFKNYLEENNLSFDENLEIQKIEEKPFVLVIDEINRANLSSVLGELIYALEYRGEAVDSMYAVEESIHSNKNHLILPPNLYIIGTMNTADRSVGHIDYAIRRRFAFVDVLPKNLSDELKDDFKHDVFAKVAQLFVKNYDPTLDYNEVSIEKSDYLSSEFDPKDVWLGHSYFIQHYEKDQHGKDDTTKRIDFDLRINFEIKPILREYVKDGILKESAISIIEELGK